MPQSRAASGFGDMWERTDAGCTDICAAVWLPVCGAWSLYGMRCADLYGLVAFARYAALSLYGMRCADWLHLRIVVASAGSAMLFSYAIEGF